MEIDYQTGWRPDLGSNIGDHLTEARNVAPCEDGYESFSGFLPATDALPGSARPLGSLSMRALNNDGLFFVGTTTKLLRLTGSTWTEVSPSTDFFTTSGDNVWDMVRYGPGAVATNFDDPIHRRIDGVDTNFAALIDINDPANWLTGVVPGSPDPEDPNFVAPRARWMCVTGQHLVLGYTADNGFGEVNNRLWWSGLGTPSNFIPDPDSLANFNDLQSGGQIQRLISSGEYAVVFQETLISRADPGNPVNGFDVREADQGRGLFMPGGAIAGAGRNVPYIAPEGFFVFDGQKSIPIGMGKVDKTFLRLYDNSQRRFVSGTVDLKNKTWIWALPLGSGNGDPTRLFIYNWAYEHWSEIEVVLFRVTNAETGGAFTDSAPFASTNTDSGEFALFPVDSPQFAGQAIKFAAFDQSNKLCFNTGPALAALLQTADLELYEGRRSILTGARPRYQGISDDNGISIAFGTRDTPTASHAYGAPALVNSHGVCTGSKSGRYTRLRQETKTGHRIERFHGTTIEDEWIQDGGLR